MNLERLPDDCFAYVLSFTSPKDACRSALVSSVLRSAADSDTVWDKFLPLKYQTILSRLDSPFPFSSKKHLFLTLCNSHFMDEGKKTFSLEKATGKTTFMLSARELSITWATNSLYWTWKCLPQSRFAEGAELITIWWLEIKGKMKTQMLSRKTLYGAYLIVKFADRAYGLDYTASEVSVEVGNLKSQGEVYLRPCEREDGWSEIEMGSFYKDEDGGVDEEMNMWLKEIKGQHLKGGLLVEGIELRPKC